MSPASRTSEIPKTAEDNEEMKVVIKFERDNNKDSANRSEQVRDIMCQLILLSRKNGRPKKVSDEEIDYAA